MGSRWVRVAALAAAVLVLVGCTRSWVTRSNVASNGTQADQPSFGGGAISGDGRFVAFESFASTLVPGDTNSATDVFVRDHVTGTTERVNVASDESQADVPTGGGVSRNIEISADGRYVVFDASFSDLVAGDTNNRNDVFLRDRFNGTTERVSLASDESEANRDSFAGDVSADGRYVAFTSSASNLVTGDTNGDPPCSHTDPSCDLAGTDVFVRDRMTGTTARVSVADDESQAEDTSGALFFTPLNGEAGISDDGRYVTFTSRALGLVSADLLNNDDIFVRDRVDATTELVSVALGGGSGNGSSFASDVSPDGRYVSFMSTSDDLVDDDPPDPFLMRHIFVRDRVSAVTERVSGATGGTLGNREPDPQSAVSADGRYVVFASFADDLVEDDTNGATDIFMRDRTLGTLERVSRAHDDGEPADTSPPPAGPFSTMPELSDDGRYLVFSSQADNIVPGDTNGLVTDVFTRFVLAPTIETATPSTIGEGTTEVTLTGGRFLPGVTVSISGSGVAVVGLTRPDESTLVVDVSVAPGASSGTRLVTVTNPGTGPGSTRGGFDVCACLAIS